MAIYAISDLHLPFGINKPMDIFGKAWENYTEKLFYNWNNTVTDDDTVIIPGDLSWATYLEQAYEDFKFLEGLKGKKIIGKGNHDYFFTTIKKMNEYLCENNFKSISILYNNYYLVEDKLICGARGWDILGKSEEDVKLVDREAIRLELSINTALKKHPDKEVMVFLHYPPLYNSILEKENKIRNILEKYNVKNCYYGHLHAKGINQAYIGNYNSVNFSLISADHLEFIPKKIM
jgi:hypothetical protein